jgi:hypothetical protein
MSFIFRMPGSVSGAFLLNLFFSAALFAQSGLPPHQVEKMNILSPQAYEMVKYGNTPVSHYTGETNLRIPVYTYKDNDFELPVYLGYNSSGFIPNKREGIVGLNWFLQLGGIITRKVNGVPDELNGEPKQAPPIFNGYFYGIKHNREIKALSPADIFTGANKAVTVTGSYFIHKDESEFTFDDFHFTMPGHNGKFYVKNGRDAVYGDARCAGNKPYFIDLSGLKEQASFWRDIQGPSVISITSPDGYRYEFGGELQHLEVSYKLDENGITQSLPVINAWHLRKITAPNGRTVVFNYLPFKPGFMEAKGPADKQHYLLNVQQEQYANQDNTVTYPGNWLSASFSSGGTGLSKYYEATKTAYLSSIVIDKTTILFDYQEKARKFYKHDIRPVWFNQNNLQLNSISVRYGDAPRSTGSDERPVFKRFQFSYVDQGGAESRHFLTAFEEAGSNPYLFSYYHADNLPDPLSHGIDYWGFWNGAVRDNGGLIPDMRYYPNGDLEYTSALREANGQKCDVALLEKVTYPTNGSTTFFYEPHQYAQRLERRSSTQFLTALFPVTGYAGGARIKRMIDQDGEKGQHVKEFVYTRNYPDATASSGILLEWPRYLYYWKYESAGAISHTLRIKSNSFHANYYPGEKYIHYAEVTEMNLPENGYTNYKFTNYETNPDDQDIRAGYYSDFHLYIQNSELYKNYTGIRYNDCSLERGLPYQVTSYSQGNAGKPVWKKTTAFPTGTDLAALRESYLASLNTSGSVVQSYKVFTYPYLPVKETEYRYSSDLQNFVVTETGFTYNDFGFLTAQTSRDSKGQEYKTTYRYPRDIDNYAGPTPNQEVVKAILKMARPEYGTRMLDAPIETVRYRDNKAIQASIQTYREDPPGSNKIYPYQHLVLENTEGLSDYRPAGFLAPDASVSDPDKSLLTDARLKEMAVANDYDDATGNLLELHKTGDMAVAYIWGYDQKYPVAEVTNAHAADIAYAGFEDDSHGGWTGTGSKVSDSKQPGVSSWLGDLSRTIAVPSVVSLWAKGGTPSMAGLQPKTGHTTPDGWTFYQWQVSAPGLVTIHHNNARLDEVRLHPVQAQMITYSYDPLLPLKGITARCDAANQYTCYEYDPYNRLYLVKDNNGDIVKNYHYNFRK